LRIKLIVVLTAVALLVTGLIPVMQVYSAPNTYYVAKTGNDITGDGSIGNPWLTIQKAANIAVASDTVYVKAGTYNEQVKVKNSGTAGNYITFKNYATDEVIIDGNGILSNGGLFHIDDKDYIYVEGFTIYRSHDTGISIVHENHYITIKNCVIDTCMSVGILVCYDTDGNTYNDGKETYITLDGVEVVNCNITPSMENISFINVSYFEVKNSLIHDEANQAGFDMKVGCHNGTVHDNEFYDLPGQGLYIDAQNYNSHHIDIYSNSFHDSPYGIIINNEVAGVAVVSYINIYNNLFYDNTFMDLLIYYEAAYTLDHIHIANNTFYHTVRGIHIGVDPGVITNSYVANNLFNQTDGEMIVYYGTVPYAGMPCDYNLFYASVSYDISNYYGTNYIYDEDPMLENPPGNLMLQIDSPAIDAASAVYAPADDFLTTARPQDIADDIGAYEFVSGSFVFNVNAISTYASINGVATIATINGE